LVSRRFPVLLGIALLALAGLGVAAARQAAAEGLELPPASFKVLPEGTRMVWENMDTGQQVEGLVGRSNGLIVNWIWQGRSFASFAHICMDCVAAGIPPDGGKLGLLFPLEVGKAVSFTRRWGGEAWHDRIEVVRSERLTVPAGDFDTFVLLRTSELVGKDWRAEQRIWYAPDLGWIVKFEGYNTRGAGERWQALSFD